ncbi:hypothetical protein MKW94_017967, partial [Papaver nudicaule]|nr:hypothetical protein [Papaver nudicaule]
MGVFTNILFIAISAFFISTLATACSNGQCKLLDECASDGDCKAGLYCSSCAMEFSGSRCVRSTVTNNSLPYNKYAYLTTHNSFATDGEPSHTGVPRVTFVNQEDTITQQLNVCKFDLYSLFIRLRLWLCHSFEGKCHHITAFEPALDTLKEIEAFLAANPSEIITLILEDYVKSQNGLTKFPVSKMPRDGKDWPLVSDMVANNQRLVVFTSDKSKQQSEGIAYQWDYMVENQYGQGGMQEGECPKRGESSPLNDKTKSLVFVNYFGSVPIKQRSAGGGTFQAVDTLNGGLLCGCDDVHACV